MRRRRRRALLPFWGPSARAAAPGAGGRAGWLQPARTAARLPALLGEAAAGWPAGVAREHFLGVRSPRVWPPSSRPLGPRPSLACDTSGCLLRWELRRCLAPEELGTALRFRGAPRSRLPRERQPRGWARSGGRESSPSGSGRGDPQVCGGAPRPLRRCLRRFSGASSEREALKCPHFPGEVKMRLL